MDAAFIALNLGQIAYVGAGFLRSGLAFRCGTIVAGVILAIWGVLEANTAVIAWNLAFVVVNVWQTVQVLRRNSITLHDEEESVRGELFTDLSKRDFLILWMAGRGETVGAGSDLCVRGAEQNDLFLVLDGDVEVVRSDGSIRPAPLRSFLGEMSFFTGQAASADVRAVRDSRVRRWNHDDVRNLSSVNEACAQALHLALGRGFAEKLNQT